MNQVKEYWYMGSMLARSEMVKNKILECLATYGRHIAIVHRLILVMSVYASDRRLTQLFPETL